MESYTIKGCIERVIQWKYICIEATSGVAGGINCSMAETTWTKSQSNHCAWAVKLLSKELRLVVT